MFTKTANYTKLKTNLRLVINRLKLLEKKKTEMALKARKEIADYMQAGKDDRARIRVEHIVREDYLVEAMEIIEMYCDLILARFGLISSQKELDPGLEEAIATLIWVTPRLQADVLELKSVAEQLSVKYSKEFAQACLKNEMNNVNDKVMHKMSVQAPPKVLVERYMIEIAKSYNVPFTPDESVMKEDELNGLDSNLLDIDPPYNKSGGGGGFPSVPQQGVAPPPLPPGGPSSFPSSGYPTNPGGPSSYIPSGSHPGYPTNQIAYPPPAPNYNSSPGPGSLGQATGGTGPEMPPPYSPTGPVIDSKSPIGGGTNLNLPELPNVPSSPSASLRSAGPGGAAGNQSDEVDFDDLSRRFEELKKRK